MNKLSNCYYLALFAFFYLCFGDEPNPKAGPKYFTPKAVGDIYLAEPFDSDDALESWTLSKATKDGVDTDIAKYNGEWGISQSKENSLSGDSGLLLKEKAKHHAISMELSRPFVFDGKPFIMQYEVNFQNGIECGGAYVKLLSQTDDLDLKQFQDKTPYTIMFGPDKCGEDYKLHFIFRHKNPITGKYEEKHAKKPTTDFKAYYTDKASHLYTLVILPDNSFKIYIDQTEINSGNLLTDMSPPVNPPKEIEDKDDKKPEDWDERETIADPDAKKPEDWDEDAPKKISDPNAEMPDDWLEDEPKYIDDPDAAKPDDWDDEMDGEWEAPKVDNPKCKDGSGCGPWEPPMIDNPAFKGKWHAPKISNPKYQGIWKPRMIPNPDFFEDKEPYKMTSIGAIGFELWSMSDEILFDNILITSEKRAADDYAEKTWRLKKIVRAENERIKRILKNKENERRRRRKQNKGIKSRTSKSKKPGMNKKRKMRAGKKPKHLKLQPGVVAGLLKATEEKPWLWIIVVLVVGLPLVLIYSFCCGKSSKKHPKKTDEPIEEDVQEPEAEEETSEEKEDKGRDSQEEEEKEELTKDDQAGTGDGKPVSKSDLEEDEDAADEGNESPRRSLRKRKVRVQE